MTRQQFALVVRYADSQDPEHEEQRYLADDSSLDGCALPSFQPVTIALPAAARWLNWHARQLDGSWSSEDLNECANIARRRIHLAE
jgi:hypothetical protein